MTNLEKYLYQLRRIEEHREKKAEKEIRKIYKELLKELNGFLGNIYATYSEGDILNYADLAKAGMDARFLEEVEQRINSISPKVAKEIQQTVEQTYNDCYNGMRNAVVKAAGNRELLQQAFATVQACTPEVIRAAVNNPVSGLTLKDTLEKHRREIIYDIKKNIGVGLRNGDRFSTMAGRIAESLDGDYTKAVRIVRTEAHRVRETGFNDAATAIDETLKKGSSGYVMAKTWHTMQDERVRPQKVKGKSKKYNHVKMDGVTIPQNELFEMPDSTAAKPVKCMCPSQTGVAGHDINCRCYLSYDLVLASELTKVQDGKKTIEEAAQVERNQKAAVEVMEQTEIDELNALLKKYPTKEHMMLFCDDIETFVRYDYLTQKAKRTAGAFDYETKFKLQNANERKLSLWYQAPTDKQRDAISTYSRNGYLEMNEHLRFGARAREEIKAQIEELKTFLDNSSTEEELYLQRGITKPALAKMLGDSALTGDVTKVIGTMFTDKGFVSTTPFTGGGFGGDVLMYIKAPRGTKGAYIKPFAASSEEKEFLLQANTKFAVKNLTIEYDKWGDPKYRLICEVVQ